MSTVVPKIFRVTVEVDDIERAAEFYAQLLDTPGKRHPGFRHYFDCGGVILAVQDVSRAGLPAHPNAKSLYFAVDDLEPVHARARALDALAPYKVHDAPGGEITMRPWRERSFYAVDPWENDLGFAPRRHALHLIAPASPGIERRMLARSMEMPRIAWRTLLPIVAFLAGLNSAPASAADMYQVRASVPPVEVVGCTPVPSGSGLAGLVASTIRVSYVSHSAKTVRFVQFQINSGGVLRHASDAGLRRKGDVVEHELVVDDGALRSRVPALCSIGYLLFNDGTTYGQRFVAAAITPERPPAQATPQFDPPSAPAPTSLVSPIAVISCDGRFDDPRNDDYDVTVGVTFQNVSSKTADVVKFELQLIDPFGKVLQHETGTMYGTFSPGVTIQPRKAALVDKFLTQPEFPNSPAWSFSNFNGHDVNRILCVPAAIHFTDGAVWNR